MFLRKFTSILLSLLSLIIIVQCKSLPPVPPAGVDSSAAAYVGELNTALGTPTATMILLAPVEKGVIQVENFIPSTYNSGDEVYWLNIPDGEYAVIALGFNRNNQQGPGPINSMESLERSVDKMASERNMSEFEKQVGKKNWHLVPEKIATKGTITVETGKLVIGGKVTLETLGMSENADQPDNLQSLVKDTIFPGLNYHRFFLVAAHEGSVDKNEETIQSILSEVKEDFTETEWHSYAD